MTVFAGAFALKDGQTLPFSIRDQLKRFISRDPADHVIEFGDAHCFLAKIDIGAFGAPGAHQDSSNHVSLLAGEPLFHSDSESMGDRAAHLMKLHSQWLRSDWSGLLRCAGTFCAVHYSPTNRRVHLVADKLGLRPIYYWASDELVIFATALRILEEVQRVPLEMDLRAVTEIACFGFPLAERTAYTRISTIGAGQVVQLSANGITTTRYWDWDRLPPVHKNLTEVSQDAYIAFHRAVERRLHGDRSAVAFLSGGLDSRSIVAALLERGAAVHTVNFALEGTQDYVFAAEMARVFGTRHHQIHADLKSMFAFRGRAYNQSLVSRMFDSDREIRLRRRLVWSGDGGSVGVGHVYLNHESTRAAQNGNMEAAIDALVRYNRQRVNPRIFHSDVARAVIEIPKQGIREELERLNCADPGRALHLFLMLNDQRRHMANFFENIDVDRLEFQFPFFDSDFLEIILRSPVEGFLRHEFYMMWLKNFPASVRSVPWQAYPGHVPCPLPVPQELGYQWKNPFPQRILRELKRALVRETSMNLQSPHFPRAIINRPMLWVANWLTRLGIRNCDYLLKLAATYCRYSSRGIRARNENETTS